MSRKESTTQAHQEVVTSHKHAHPKLNQLYATAICGNDIMSSVLYLAGFTVTFAGIWAPGVLLIIAFVLYLYKKVYTEVVEALPVNGGAYNCLLNGTSKSLAAIAGIMTILSYIATAVISGKVGVQYLFTILPFGETIHLGSIALSSNSFVLASTILLLLVFALLVISGLKDSAKVALAIFITHISTLVLFILAGVVYILLNRQGLFTTEIFHFNALKTYNPLDHTAIFSIYSVPFALFLAFSTSLLGVTGFESSANFVEEQAPGVFRKTLRNMLWGVTIFNPIIAFILLNVLPYDIFTDPLKRDFLLAVGSKELGGHLLNVIVAVDGFMVLSGAVLTAFVGVSGLISRMSADSCFPQALARPNKVGSFPVVIWSFFLACTSIIIITQGDLSSLAGVYTIAFLGVMTLFAAGNLVLKETRKELKRTYSAPLLAVLLAFLSTAIGVTGNIKVGENNLKFFLIYFLPVITFAYLYIYRDYVMKFFLRMTKAVPSINIYLREHFKGIVNNKYLVFVHQETRLSTVFDYISKNETGLNIILVHCSSHKNTHDFQALKESIPVLQRCGVGTSFNVELVHKNAEFGPEIVDEVSKEYSIPKNKIFIGSIHENHTFDYEDLGGVRIIF